MTKTPKPPKSAEQREAEKRRKEFADKLELIAEYLGEDDFVAAVKGYKPDVTKDELREWVYAVSRRRPREARALLTMRSKFSSAFLNSSLLSFLR